MVLIQQIIKNEIKESIIKIENTPHKKRERLRVRDDHSGH